VYTGLLDANLRVDTAFGMHRPGGVSRPAFFVTIR
jgi:hypothetical protein